MKLTRRPRQPTHALLAGAIALAFTASTVHAAQNCTGTQIEKMISSGFSKEEIKQLCGGDAPPAASKPTNNAANPLLGTWKPVVAAGDETMVGWACKHMGIVEFREKTFRQTVTEQDLKDQESMTENLLGKEFTKELAEMQKELGVGQQTGSVRVVEYVQDGADWIVLDPKSGEHIMLVQPHGAKQLQVTKGAAQCSLARVQ